MNIFSFCCFKKWNLRKQKFGCGDYIPRRKLPQRIFIQIQQRLCSDALSSVKNNIMEDKCIYDPLVDIS